MDEDIFDMMTTMIALVIIGIFYGLLITTNLVSNQVINQLCQKQLYDFCEIDRYNMKGDLK